MATPTSSLHSSSRHRDAICGMRSLDLCDSKPPDEKGHPLHTANVYRVLYDQTVTTMWSDRPPYITTTTRCTCLEG